MLCKSIYIETRMEEVELLHKFPIKANESQIRGLFKHRKTGFCEIQGFVSDNATIGDVFTGSVEINQVYFTRDGVDQWKYCYSFTQS